MLPSSTTMAIVYGATATTVLLAAATVVLAGRQYRRDGRLSRLTVLLAWGSYSLHALLTCYVAWEGIWTIPVHGALGLAVGVAFGLAGAALYAAGMVTMRSLRSASGLAAEGLVTSGIYRWSRNPQMMGWILILLGVSAAGRSGYGLLLVVLFVVLFRVTLIAEEAHLERVFGDAYRTYCGRASRYLGWPGPE